MSELMTINVDDDDFKYYIQKNISIYIYVCGLKHDGSYSEVMNGFFFPFAFL